MERGTFMLKKRAEKLLQAMPQGFEAALVQTEQNRFYFLDFDSGDAGTLLILPNKMVFIIDSRYMEIAQKQIEGVELVLEENALEQAYEILQQEGVHKVYLENKISVCSYNLVKQRFANIDLDAGAALSGAIDSLRAIKDEVEIARMEQAQKITDDCFTHILPFIKEGVREIDIMLEMEYYMRSHGAEKVAFDTICVAGTNSSLPHGVPGENRVKPGDFITLDFGAKVGGYCTDMTRTVAFGQPSAEQKKVYDMVLRAQLAGIAAARPGVQGWEVDKVARDIIYGEGYEGYFGHGLGHAVGIEIHENPRFSPKSQEDILPGMMLTVEPGCYLPGRFGVRIEDTVLICENGCRTLANSEKGLIIL